MFEFSHWIDYFWLLMIIDNNSTNLNWIIENSNNNNNNILKSLFFKVEIAVIKGQKIMSNFNDFFTFTVLNLIFEFSHWNDYFWLLMIINSLFSSIII